MDPKCIERYLESYDQSLIHEELLGTTTSRASEDNDTFPILFFAAERNSPEILNMLCERGADVDGRAEPSGLPLLAYTILSSTVKVGRLMQFLALIHTPMHQNARGMLI